MIDKDITFLILSNQPFDFPLPTNKWHVGTRLAQRGFDVLFVDPPLRFKALKNRKLKDFLSIKNIFFKTESINKNLTVYKPVNIFNFYPFSLINTYFHSRNINSLLNKNKKLVIWVYHFDFPDLENFLKSFSEYKLIYDVVDEYTAFPEYANRKKVNTGIVSLIQWFDDELKILFNQKGLSGVDWVLHREKWLAKNADLMFASAPGLVKKFKKWRKEVHYLPNACAYEKFDVSKSIDEPDDIKDIKHPRIGFSGAIDTYKNNLDLIEKSSLRYPQYNFILIGPEKVADPDLDLSSLKKIKNIYFLGMRSWDKTPNYFAHFDAYFIPYNLNDYTIKGCFPVKYFESLACGLPTVVTNLPAYEGFDVDGYVSKNDDEFIENLGRAIKENDNDKVEKRKLLAKDNSWDGKVDKQLKLISSISK